MMSDAKAINPDVVFLFINSTAATAGATDLPLPEDDDLFARAPMQARMTNIARLVISSAAELRCWLSFERDFARYRLAGASTDLQCSGRRWAGDVAAVASLRLAEQQAADFGEPLPGLGAPSDFAVLADPVAVGDSVMSSHGDLLVGSAIINVKGIFYLDRSGRKAYIVYLAKQFPFFFWLEKWFGKSCYYFLWIFEIQKSCTGAIDITLDGVIYRMINEQPAKLRFYGWATTAYVAYFVWKGRAHHNALFEMQEIMLPEFINVY
jgi:hypothetical protein